MTPKGKKKGKKKDFYLYIYEYIKNHQKLPADLCSKQKLNYYVKQLKEAYIIDRAGYGVWKVTGDFADFRSTKEVKKMKELGSAEIPKKEFRSHAYRFRVLLPFIDHWDKRKLILDKYNIFHKDIKQGQSLKVRGHTIWLCSRTIKIVFQENLSFFGNDTDENTKIAIMECKNTLKELQKLLKVNLKYGKSWAIQETNSHHAKIKSFVAQYYRNKGINYFEIKQHNKVWLLMDNSFNLSELETVASYGKSSDDMKIVKGFFNDLRNNPAQFKERDDKIDKIEGIMLTMAERQDALQQQLMALVEIVKRKI